MKVCFNTDKLYLLEIMVSRLCIDYDKVPIDPEKISKMKQVVVLCQFQDFPPLEIREEEFCKVRENDDNQNEIIFNSVAREINEKLGRVVLGSTFAQLDWHFVEVMKEDGLQNSRSFLQTYPIYSKENCRIGNICLCVRLSGLGNMILTSLKGGTDNEPFAVKGKGVTIEHGPHGDHSSMGRLLGGADQPYVQPYPQYPQYNAVQNANLGAVNTMYAPTQNFNMNSLNQMISPMQMMNMCPVNPIFGQPQMQNLPFCGQIPIRSFSSSSDEEPPPPPPQWPADMFCSCDYPLPPGFEEPPRPQPKKKKKKKKKIENPCSLDTKGNYCLQPNCPMGYPQFPNFPGEKKTWPQFPVQNPPFYGYVPIRS